MTFSLFINQKTSSLGGIMQRTNEIYESIFLSDRTVFNHYIGKLVEYLDHETLVKVADKIIEEHDDKELTKVALKLYDEAIKLDSFDAKHHLARLYIAGKHVPQNIHKAIELLFEISKRYDYDATHTYFELLTSSDFKNLDPQPELDPWTFEIFNSLGVDYLRGEDMFESRDFKEDIERGLAYLKFAAFNKSGQAMFNLAGYYKHGELIEKNVPQAVTLYEQVYAAGLPSAGIELALIYIEGDGVTQDLTKGLNILIDVLEHDNALLHLAKLYRSFKSEQYNLPSLTELFITALENGETKALYFLALLYELDEYSEEDVLNIFETHHIETSEFDVDEVRHIAYMFLEGEFGEKSINKAITFFNLTALLGEAYGLITIGDIFKDGEHTEVNREEAIKYYKKAAAALEHQALIRLAELYLEEKTLESTRRAVNYLEAAIAAEETAAVKLLLKVYLDEKYNYKNVTKAFAIIEKQTANDNYGFLFDIVNYYYRGNILEDDLRGIVPYFKAGVEAGYQLFSLSLANFYQRGTFVDQDINEAIKWYEYALEYYPGHAHNYLGELYLNEDYTVFNFEKALAYFEEGAALDDGDALTNLALFYARGKYAPRDKEKALGYYRKAFKTSNSEARKNYAIEFELGEIVEQDFHKARERFEEYIKYGHGDDYTILAKLGYYYYFGRGGEKSLEKAKEYFEDAIYFGYQSTRTLEVIKRELGEEVDEENSIKHTLEKVTLEKFIHEDFNIHIKNIVETEFAAAWKVLQDNTKIFVLDAVRLYTINRLLPMPEQDYSSTVVAIGKALELELKKYFYLYYLAYIIKFKVPFSKVDPSSNSQSILLQTVKGKTRYRKYTPYRFTLGSFQYVTGNAVTKSRLDSSLTTKKRSELSSTDKTVLAQETVTHEKYHIYEAMVDYAKYLFKDEMTVLEIKKYLTYLAEEIDFINENLRNPSAHTETMSQFKAELAINLVIKVEKILVHLINRIDNKRLEELEKTIRKNPYYFKDIDA